MFFKRYVINFFYYYYFIIRDEFEFNDLEYLCVDFRIKSQQNLLRASSFFFLINLRGEALGFLRSFIGWKIRVGNDETVLVVQRIVFVFDAVVDHLRLAEEEG